ncbi:MAG: hypothetical protein KDD99_12800 [Bacteroidetes bacterium]|nr:hypothetical protein [Bacteroidota bacterium]
MINDRINAYQQRVQTHLENLSANKRKYDLLSYSRFAVFILGIAVVYFLFKVHVLAGLVGGMGMLVLFLYLIKIHTQVAENREHQSRLQKINEDEIRTLKGDWRDRDAGKDYIDHSHPYTYDLDIFGRASIFQYINRTGTILGRKVLSNWVQNPSQEVEEIKSRQEAVKNLAKKIDWNLNFQALGAGNLESEDDSASILKWLEEPLYFSTHPVYPKLLWVLPVLFFTAMAFWIIPDIPGLREPLGFLQIPGTIPTAIFLINLAIIGTNLRRTGKQQIQVGKKSTMLRKYATLLAQIENETFDAPRLVENQKKLAHEGTKASEAIQQLGDLTYMLDQRLNIMMGLFLNGALLWDILYQVKLEKWRQTYQEKLPVWFSVISEWDALVSLGRFAYNRPKLIFPSINNGPFHLKAEALGHPLLNPQNRIDNDVEIGGPGEFLIITGANMAGKSTFLRTVGVNLILAMNGAPVCAKAYSFAPIEMITSVRATDSLDDHESYFYAELKQLKKIIDKLQEGKPVFIIVDEMLRGTNSRDKQVGSRKFIEQLMKLNGVGLVATHDLSLGTLADEYPGKARNKRFEVEIKDDQLDFDYKLRDGISQNLNATFLMQKMGIMP